MAVIEQDVLRVIESDAATLESTILERQLGFETTNYKMGIKFPGGDMKWFSPDGAGDYGTYSINNLDNVLWVNNTDSGTKSSFAVTSEDGDGSDNVSINIFGHGTKDNAQTSQESLQLVARSDGSNTATFDIWSNHTNRSAKPIRIFVEGQTSQLYLKENGLVGVGTIPTEKLHIDGAIIIGDATQSGDGTIRYTGSDFEGRIGGAWQSLSSQGNLTGTGTTGKLAKYTGASAVGDADIDSFISGTANQVTVTDDGDGTATIALPSSIIAPGSIDASGTIGGMTSDEMDQIANIGTNTISSQQWGYLGDLDQGLSTTADATFNSLDTGQGNNELYPMNQSVLTTSNVNFNDGTFAGTVDTYHSVSEWAEIDDLEVSVTAQFDAPTKFRQNVQHLSSYIQLSNATTGNIVDVDGWFIDLVGNDMVISTPEQLSDDAEFKVTVDGGSAVMALGGTDGLFELNVPLYLSSDHTIYFGHDGITNSDNDYMRYDDANFIGSKGAFSFHADGGRNELVSSPTAAISAEGVYVSDVVAIDTTSPDSGVGIDSNGSIQTRNCFVNRYSSRQTTTPTGSGNKNLTPTGGDIYVDASGITGNTTLILQSGTLPLGSIVNVILDYNGTGYTLTVRDPDINWSRDDSSGIKAFAVKKVDTALSSEHWMILG